MRYISDTIKESIIKKALGKNGAIIQTIAKENNVGFSSIKKWMREHQLGRLKSTNSTAHKPLSRAARLEHILATAALDEQALGVYCRERGLYAVQLAEWKNAIMKDTNEEKYQALLLENKTLRGEIKELKKDVHRKDRALAETTALLVLKKKAALIWGESEDS
jgi:transposase